MYYKISPVIIIVLIIIVLVITGVGVKLLIFDDKNINPNQNIVSEVIPELELSINTEELDQEYVIIKAVATIEPPDEIYSITLPSGAIKRASEVEYTVKENGNYIFRVKASNGKSSSRAIEVNNIREASPNNPYIPEGFSHIGGNADSGFVIQDSYKNEFVWVPVEDGKLTRNTMLDMDYEETNSTATELVNSVAQNYGFYIGRYESSMYNLNGEAISASIGNTRPWTNVDYNMAYNASARAGELFGYEGYKTSLINSMAWDTTTAWIDKTVESYSTSTSYGNYSGSVRNTGTTEEDIKNNICDMSGNVREWTTEIFKYKLPQKNNYSYNYDNETEVINYRVIRGGSASVSRTPNSHTGYKESMSDAYWGFRMILYK